MKQMIAALVFVAAAATTATAQNDSAQASADQDCSRARKAGKACTLTFEGDDVAGGVIKPDGDHGSGREISKFGSLIRLRWDFRAAIIRSVEDL
jgi:hypothetical protein